MEDLEKKNQALVKDKTDLKTMLDQAIEEKKKFSERINQLNIIGNFVFIFYILTVDFMFI